MSLIEGVLDIDLVVKPLKRFDVSFRFDPKSRQYFVSIPGKHSQKLKDIINKKDKNNLSQFLVDFRQEKMKDGKFIAVLNFES